MGLHALLTVQTGKELFAFAVSFLRVKGGVSQSIVGGCRRTNPQSHYSTLYSRSKQEVSTITLAKFVIH